MREVCSLLYLWLLKVEWSNMKISRITIVLAKNVIDIVPSNLILCFSLIVIKTAIDYNKSENILK